MRFFVFVGVMVGIGLVPGFARAQGLPDGVRNARAIQSHMRNMDLGLSAQEAAALHDEQRARRAAVQARAYKRKHRSLAAVKNHPVVKASPEGPVAGGR